MVHVHPGEPARPLILLKLAPVLLIILLKVAISHNVMLAGIAAPGTNNNYLHSHHYISGVVLCLACDSLWGDQDVGGLG